VPDYLLYNISLLAITNVDRTSLFAPMSWRRSGFLMTVGRFFSHEFFFRVRGCVGRARLGFCLGFAVAWAIPITI
jgi:hypothetical protein